jgi:hypothetical protein
MSWAEICSILALVASGLAVGLSIITLRLQRVPPELAALSSKVLTLDADLTELADRQNTWMRRDAARTARAGQGTSPPPPTGPADVKAELRRRVAALRGAPNA